MQSGIEHPAQISLTVPAMPEFLRVARVTASGLASRLGFSLDDVDDLRLALDELCFALIGKGDATGALELKYVMSDDGLSIGGTYRRPVTAPPVNGEPAGLGELSRQILTALVDSHQLWDEDNAGYFSLDKRIAN